MKKWIYTIALTGLLVGIGAAVQAQGQGHDCMMGDDHHHGMEGGKMQQAMVTKHLEELKGKLKITAAQESAWANFTAAMAPPADMPKDKRPDPAELEKLSVPERIDKMHAMHQEHMAAMQAQMEKRDAAIKALYSTLSPEQKKIADEEHAKMMRHMGERMGHGKRHHGDGDGAK